MYAATIFAPAMWSGLVGSFNTLDVSGCGVAANATANNVLGIEMVRDKAQRIPMGRADDVPSRVAKAAYQAGLMVRISGANLILSPPLVITRAQVDELVEKARRALDGTLQAVRAGI